MNDKYSIIRITGPDSAKFLQGQLSNDIDLLKKKPWQFSCYCNQKGRIIAFVWLTLLEDGYYLCLPDSTLPLTSAELKKFGAFSKVEIEVIENIVCLPICDKIPTKIQDKALICMEYIARSTTSLILIPKASVTNNTKSSKNWGVFNINNKLPIISKIQQEHFTPHQLGLQLKNAVSFKKGCYRGQEIIARMEYLGKLKQALYHIEIQSLSEPKALDQLATKENRIIGEIVNVVHTGQNLYEALAVLNNVAIEAEETKLIPLRNDQHLRVIE